MSDNTTGLFEQAWLDFLQKPDARHYLTVMALYTASGAYNPGSNELADVLELVEAQAWDAARKRALEISSAYLLSPGYHMTLSYICSQLEDELGANVEQHIQMACISGMLACGDGSEERPWPVTRISDEYDILRALGKESVAAEQFEAGERVLDCHTLGEGEEVWFDVTFPLQKLGEDALRE